jgi:ubiquinone/menaquinone biosynthesis C-methylase UbiE
LRALLGWIGLTVVSRSQEMYPNDLAEMEAWIRSHARPGDRVLEIGCGDGALVRRLMTDYDVIGVDPSASPEAAVLAIPFEELEAAPFDVVFASVSLHHLADLTAAVAALRRLTRPGTMMLVREFDRVLNDHEPTLRWWFTHRELEDPEEHSGSHPLPDTFEAFVPHWRHMMQHHVSTWAEVLDMLVAADFETVSDVRAPYLFRWGLNEDLRAEEERLAADGIINLIGHHWTGRRAS